MQLNKAEQLLQAHGFWIHRQGKHSVWTNGIKSFYLSHGSQSSKMEARLRSFIRKEIKEKTQPS
jgi:hypothetical protein